MAETPIADHWDQILQCSGVALPDVDLMLVRGMFFAGAMAALHELTGWDPTHDDAQIVAVNRQNLEIVMQELTTIYRIQDAEICQAVQ